MKVTYLASGLSLILSSVALLPTAAKSIEPTANTQHIAEQSQQQPFLASSERLDNQIEQSLLLRDNPIEDRFNSGRMTAERSYTFQGNENELVVIYFESAPDYFASSYYNISLQTASGRLVGTESNLYSTQLSFEEQNGTHQMFLLPETGEYELAINPIRIFRDIGPSNIVEQTHSYLVKVRVADASERFLIAGNHKLIAEDYLAAAEIFSQAASYAPDQSGPYMGRLLAYASHAFFLDDSIGNGISGTEGFQIIYDRLSSEQQSTVLLDLRRLGGILQAVIDSGESDLDGFDPQLAEDMAIYLETGTASEPLQTVMDEIW
ncbi:MAG: hypothetical protein AAFR58_17120 [Cyanobacteria bacterium J06627_28]